MSNQTEIILLGTFHFQQDEEMIIEKESEIIELVEHLSSLKPTKIALEWEKSKNKQLNEAYKNTDRDLRIDEIEQIGFRLAKKLNHGKIYAVNWGGHLKDEDVILLNNTIKKSYPELLNSMSSVMEETPEINRNTNIITLL
ncbi:DUF5694 domain-containing protein [Bacillus salitolerans]|uniref:DUF5694 domain-containing protein n=1 Tax=Bacillus salitolerans TaxID=1437434 RepID=A0ABW4LNS5_9BACI